MDLIIPSQYLIGGEGDTKVVALSRQISDSNAAIKYLDAQQRDTLIGGSPSEMRKILHRLYWRQLEACRRFATHRPHCKQLSRHDQTVINTSVRGRRLTQDEHLDLVSALTHLKQLLEQPLKLVSNG